MRNKLWIPAALIATLGLSAAAWAGPHGDGGPGRGHRGGPFMQELKDLGLSEEQKTTIKSLHHNRRQEGKAQRESLRTLRRSFEIAVPGSATYSNAATELAEAEAVQARTRVQDQAEMRSQIYQVLTPQQRSKLAEELANRPEPPAKPLR